MPYLYSCSDPNYSIYVGIDSDENDLLAKYGWPNDILFHVSNLSSGHIYLRTPLDSIDLNTFKKVNQVSDFFKLFKIPINVIEEAMHLTKFSSIKGIKLDSVNIDITPWLNVEKVKGTKSGSIHFKKMKYVTVLNISYQNKTPNAQQKPTNKKKKKKKKKLSDHEQKRSDDRFYDDFLDDSNDDDSDDSTSNKTIQIQNIYNKKKWKKKLKALEKTKQIVEVKNVEKYLMEQQAQRNQELKAMQKDQKKESKKRQKKEKLEKKRKQDLKNYVGAFDYDDMTSNQNMADDYEDTFM
eukprot:62984_1